MIETLANRAMLQRTARPRVVYLSALAVLCLTAVAGCNHGPQMAQVRGKVLYKDGSVPRGGVHVVRFEPTSDTTAVLRKGASGEIGEDGSFQLWTRVPGDGVYPGKYSVTFVVRRLPMDPATSLILPKYTASATTPFHETIDRDRDDLKFEIEPLPGAAGGGAGGDAKPAAAPAPAAG